MKLFKRKAAKSLGSRKRSLGSLSKSSPRSTVSLAEQFKDSVDAAQLDLLVDLNEEFFQDSYLLVQTLSTRDSFVAGKIKRYVDILVRLHARYATEVDEVKTLRLKVRTADEKLELALRTTSTSEAMMEKLRESLEEAWRNEDVTKNREEMRQIQLLALGRTDQPESIKMATEQSHTGKEGRIRSLVFRERDRLAGELKDYQKRLATNRFYAEYLEDMLEATKESIGALQVRIKLAESENYRLEHKARLEQDGARERQLQLSKEIAALQQQVRDLQFVQKDLAETTAANDALRQRNDRLGRDNYKLSKSNHVIAEQKKRLQTSLKLAEDMNNAQRRANGDLEAAHRAAEQMAKKKTEDSLVLERRFIQLAKKNSDLNDQALVNQNEIKVLEKKIMVLTAQLDEAVSQKDEMARTRDKLRIEITRLNDTVAVVRHEIAGVRHQVQDLQTALLRANKLLDERDLQVQKIAREKRDVLMELNDAYKKIDGLEEGLSAKTERLEAVQQELQQKQLDFANAKKQMEIVHSEKVLLIKNLDMCSRDRAALQTTQTKLSHQINQQSSSLAGSEKEISSLRNQIEQLGRTVRQKQNEIHAKGRLLAGTRSDLREMKIRVEQTQLTIDSDEKRFKSMSCALDEVTKEKSLVALQMVRRNDELRLLREQLAMMQTAIDRGTTQYKQRVEDIRLLKLEVANLRMSHECMQKEVGNRADLRQDVVRLERQLNQERLRVSAYSEELSRPCRIHRWRVLLGKDPRRFDLIRKVQFLLKRNIRLSVERENLAKELADAVRLHEAFKRQVERTADPQAREKLCVQQNINRRQKRRLKAMTAELRINEIDLKARERLIEGFQQELLLRQQESQVSAIGGGDSPDYRLQAIDERFLDQIFEPLSTSTPESCKDR